MPISRWLFLTSTYWNSYNERSTDTCSNMEKSRDMIPSEPSQKTISCILVMRCPKQEVHRDRKTRTREVAVVTLFAVLSLVNWPINCSKTDFGIGCPIYEKNSRNYWATHITCVSTWHEYLIKLHLFEFKTSTVCVASSRSARATQ